VFYLSYALIIISRVPGDRFTARVNRTQLVESSTSREGAFSTRIRLRAPAEGRAWPDQLMEWDSSAAPCSQWYRRHLPHCPTSWCPPSWVPSTWSHWVCPSAPSARDAASHWDSVHRSTAAVHRYYDVKWRCSRRLAARSPHSHSSPASVLGSSASRSPNFPRCPPDSHLFG